MATDFETFAAESSYCEQLRHQLSDFDSETYNPLQAIADIWYGFKLYARCCRLGRVNLLTGPFQYLRDVARFGYIGLDEIAIVIAMAIIWTLVRYLLTWGFYQPFARAWKMEPANAAKFPESAFKSLAYFFLWSSAVYVVFFRGHNYYNNSLMIWKEVLPKYSTSTDQDDLRFLYGLESSFYIHSIYATLYMDRKRRDTFAMLLHHALTLCLIGVAHIAGYWKIGSFIFLYDDIGDVFLETAKWLGYLRVHGSTCYHLWDNLSTACAALFAITWTIFRNLFHLTKVLRSTALGSFISAPILPSPFWIVTNAMLSLLYIFYLYWYYFIVLFIYRMLTGKMKNAEDTREDDESTAKKDD